MLRPVSDESVLSACALALLLVNILCGSDSQNDLKEGKSYQKRIDCSSLAVPLSVWLSLVLSGRTLRWKIVGIVKQDDEERN